MQRTVDISFVPIQPPTPYPLFLPIRGEGSLLVAALGTVRMVVEYMRLKVQAASVSTSSGTELCCVALYFVLCTLVCVLSVVSCVLCTVLFLYSCVLSYDLLYCTVLFCTALLCTTRHGTVLYCTALYYVSGLQYLS